MDGIESLFPMTRKQRGDTIHAMAFFDELRSLKVASRRLVYVAKRNPDLFPSDACDVIQCMNDDLRHIAMYLKRAGK
jgi:hypothetical protein